MRRGGGKGNVFLKLSQMDCAGTDMQRGCMCKSDINTMLHRLQDDNCRIKVLRMRVAFKRYSFQALIIPPFSQ